jgi:hypothetical protein
MLSDLKIVLWYAGHKEVFSQFTFVRYLFDQTCFVVVFLQKWNIVW